MSFGVALVMGCAVLGAAIKLWPVLLLFGEWDRRRLARSALAALAVVVVIFAASAIAFGNPAGFLSNGGDRGLQEEAVAIAQRAIALHPAATLPWRALCNILPYRDGTTAKELLAAMQEYAARLPRTRFPPLANTAKPDRRLPWACCPAHCERTQSAG